MIKYASDVYDLCSSTAKKALDSFCFAINNSGADVFVVMAHKAVRLFQILLDQKHISDEVANKTIISNHALDFDCSYLLGKKIAVIDDILISGTSIASTVHKLLNIGIAEDNISIITLAIDKRYQSMRFDTSVGKDILNCHMMLDDATCIELSSTISKIFSYYGISYDVDYPNYNAIDLNNNKTNLLFNDFFWQTDKISNGEQKAGNIDAYILFPNECVRKMLWKRIGANLEESAHLKLRAYVKKYPSGKQECYIVPMCLFNEISENDIETLYNICTPAPNGLSLPNNAFVAKMRYLQFYIAHQLYLTFNDVTSFACDTQPSMVSINLLFGINDGIKLFDELNCSHYLYDSVVQVKIADYIDESIIDEYWNSDIGKNILFDISKLKKKNSFNQEYWDNRVVFMPFLWWYDTKEIPVRNDLFNKSSHYIKNYREIESKLKRLNSGFSLQTLKKILSNVLENYELEHLVSIFIDRAIDEGIIVPTITYNEANHCLCRVYRHGEDLPFGLQDECRLLYFLECLIEKIPNITISSNKTDALDGIATVSFEKMIVLFYQMGLEQGNIFNRFLGFSNIKLLKPFLSVHGTVEGFVDPKEIEEQNITEHFYSESLEGGDRYITWLTNWLLENNFIKKIDLQSTSNHDRKVYIINRDLIHDYLIKNERSCISNVIQENISNIASMIATWYNTMSKSEGKDMFKEDAIALTSCSNIYTFASAIATEIHYFSRFWRQQVKKAFDNPSDISDLINALKESDEDKNQTLKVEQALYSGRNKVDFFNSRRATVVIQKVANILKDNGVSVWTEIWDSVKCDDYSKADDLKIYVDQAIGFLYFYSACFDCLKSKQFWDTGEKPLKYIEYKKLYADQCKKSYLLKKDLFKKIDDIERLSKFKNKISKFYSIVNLAINDSEDSVINIEKEVENGAKNYTIRYKSALIFEIRAFDNAQNDSRIMNVWDQLEEDVNKTQINIIRFPNTSIDSKFIQYGFFYGSSFDKKEYDYLSCGRVLVDLYQKLCAEFAGKVYEIKAIMIPDTPPGRMFEHNVQRNIVKSAEKFAINIVDLLKDNYKRDTKQQLVVAMTDYVDIEFQHDIDNMNWDNRCDLENLDSNKLFPTVITCYNDYVHPISTQKEVDYSIVKVVCGKNIGAGFLLKALDRIVCVSCNHIFSLYKESSPKAISVYGDEKSFMLEPIKDIIITQNDLSAQNEIAILDIQWDGRIPFDMSNILSLDDFNHNAADHINSECMCCGYPDGEQLWSDTFTLMRRSGKGYCQTQIHEEGNNPPEQGYSGGIIVLLNNSNCIIGIHEGRYNDSRGRMIPSEVIKDTIEKEITTWQNQTK